MQARPFLKMHGLGNDFVVFDARRQPLSLTTANVRAIADRHTGIGCDQLIVIEPAPQADADVFMRIYNADGDEVGACGNASRCVAWLLMQEHDRRGVRIATASGIVSAEAASGTAIAVDMGVVRCAWQEIPLAEPADTLHLGITALPLHDPVAVSVGNPHAVFFVDDADAVPLAIVGPVIERHPLFPQRTNVEAAAVLSRERIRLRVWERGAGITRACGTGACAAAVAACRRGLTGRRVTVDLDGGSLAVEWRDDDHVIMTGPASLSFTGVLGPSLMPVGGADG
jgi:diaminopimelate epimerase